MPQECLRYAWRLDNETKRKKKKKLNDTSRLFWIFILPWLIGFGAFTCFPMIYSFVMSFTNWNGLTNRDFIGISNFIQILTKDKTFLLSLKNTFFYIGVSVPLNTVVSIFLAMLLNKRLLGTNVFRGIFIFLLSARGLLLILRGHICLMAPTDLSM